MPRSPARRAPHEREQSRAANIGCRLTVGPVEDRVGCGDAGGFARAVSQLLDKGFKCEARVLLSYRLDFVRHRLAQSMGEIDLGSKDARVPWASGPLLSAYHPIRACCLRY